MSKLTGSRKATQFTESVIREMTRLNQLYGGVNLSQGFPDFPAPAVIKDAASAAIYADINQYAVPIFRLASAVVSIEIENRRR